MARRTGFLLALLIVVVIGLIIFYLFGGSLDVDAQINWPNADIEGGSLPDVDVERAPEAEAGDPE